MRTGGHSQDEVSAAVGADAVNFGQMIVNAKLRSELTTKITALVGGPSGDITLENAFQAVLTEIDARRWNTVSVRRQQLTAMLRTSGHPNARQALALIGPDSARSADSGGALVQKLWAGYIDQGSTFPSLSPYLTLAHLEGAWRWEVSACFTTAERTGTKLLTKAAGARTDATKLANTTIITEVRKGDRVAEASALAAGRLVRGDEVKSVSNVAGIAAKMRAALADGWVLHARVVSGIYLDRAAKSTPNEEHSLLIVGFSGDTFTYLDPDVGGSARRPSAYNTLYFDSTAGRLSTASSDADFAVDGGGYQASGVHRYQVVRVFTVQ